MVEVRMHIHLCHPPLVLHLVCKLPDCHKRPALVADVVIDSTP